MAATVDLYTSRSQLPSAPTHTTIAVVTENKVASLWIFISGTGWLQAAHGAANNI